MSACDLAVYSIDLIIFTSLLFCIGGVIHAEKIARDRPGRWSQFLSFHSGKIGLVAASPEDDGDLSDLTTRQILLGLFIIALIQLSQWAIILLACQLGSVFWEGLIVSGSAIATGMIIKKRWHRDSVFLCTIASTIIFYAAAKAIPSFTVSLFIPVLTGLAIMIGLYLVALRLDPPDFALAKHCDPVQLRQIATAKGLTPYEIDLLDAKFCKAMTQAQLEIRFSGWSLSSIKRMIKAAKEKFYQ
jgi:hypothetical protein